MGVRPEDVITTDEGGHPASVISISHTGPETTVHARVGDQDVHLLRPEGESLETGQAIQVAFRAKRVHAFNHLGQRLSQNIS
jgi:ABC-type sugar transport system ATPase subunit